MLSTDAAHPAGFLAAPRHTHQPGCQRFFAIEAAGHSLLRAATRQLDLTPAVVAQTLRLARTIADGSTELAEVLANADAIGAAHLAEALQYRPRPTLEQDRSPLV